MKDLCKRLLSKKVVLSCSILLLLTLALGSSTTAFSQEAGDGKVVRMIVTRTRIRWVPLVEHESSVLTVSGPGELVYSQAFGPGAVPRFSLADASGDGLYKYELQLVPIDDGNAQSSVGDAERGLASVSDQEPLVDAGAFTVAGGYFVAPIMEPDNEDLIVAPDLSDQVTAPADQCILDDLIVDGSLCVGFDCPCSGESFGFDTIRLKENNLRIHFQDTSTSASFPTNDWRISINDSANGGASYFAIQDVDSGTNVFVVEASAGSNALYVDDYGRVGLGTSTPAVELEVRDGDTPTVRLNQDGSSGWAAQTWDLASNESNFFIRDATNGSQLPFRIQPGADSSALTIKSDNSIGIGTWSPAQSVEVERTSENAVLLLDRTDGAQFKMVAGFDRVTFGSQSNHPMQLIVNDTPVAELNSSGDLTIGGELTATSCNCSSDVNAKENFGPVDGKEVLAQLENVDITTWNFKTDADSVRHMGPTAQDFYTAYGLGADDKYINTVDVAGVALVAIKELDAQNKALEAENAELEARLTALEQVAGLSPEPRVSFANLLPWLLVGVLLVGIGMMGGFVLAMRKRLGRATS